MNGPIFFLKKLSLTVKASFLFWRLRLTFHRRISAAANVVNIRRRLCWLEGAPFSPGDRTLIFHPKFWNITFFIMIIFRIVQLQHSTSWKSWQWHVLISGLCCPVFGATDDGREEICTGLLPTQFQTYLIEISKYFMVKYVLT